MPTWPSTAGALNPVISGGRDGGGGLADQVGGLAPAAAQRQRDVVVGDAGLLGDLGGRAGRDLERVGIRVVERVAVVRRLERIRGSEPWPPL